MNKKKLAPLRVKNEVTHPIQLKLHERMTKSRFQVVATSHGRNESLVGETKKTKGRPIITPAIAVRLLTRNKQVFMHVFILDNTFEN